jgi:hypothetical protein
MFESYLSGYFFASIIGLIKIYSWINETCSTKSTNFQKINLYYNPWLNKFEAEKISWFSWMSAAIYVLLISPIFSWLTVASYVANFISEKSKQSLVPEKIKEIRYKISNFNLSKEELVKLQFQFNHLTGVDGPVYISKEADPFDCYFLEEVDEYGGYRGYEIKPSQKIIKYEGHPPDCSTRVELDYIYKLEEQKVLIKCHEYSVDNYGKKTFYIQNGKLNFAEIEKHFNESAYSKDTLEEEIDSYRLKSSWIIPEDRRLKYFILSHHPEVIALNDLKKQLKLEFDEIKKNVEQFHSSLSVLGVDILENKTSDNLLIPYLFPENPTPEMEEQINKAFSEEGLREFNLTRDELDTYASFKEFAMKYI